MQKLVFVLSLAVVVTACSSTSPSEESEADKLHKASQDTVAAMQKKDPALKEWFAEKSAGYVIYPSAGKGGLILGGAYGRGEVYQASKLIGYSTMKQGSVGLQAGGQEFAQVVFFKDETALKNFQRGNFEMGAEATAVAVKAGAAASEDYDKGVAVFIWSKAGLMAEAALAGQKLSYEPKK